MWSARHEQAAAPFALTEHSLYGPQGEGEQADLLCPKKIVMVNYRSRLITITPFSPSTP